MFCIIIKCDITNMYVKTTYFFKNNNYSNVNIENNDEMIFSFVAINNNCYTLFDTLSRNGNFDRNINFNNRQQLFDFEITDVCVNFI